MNEEKLECIINELRASMYFFESLKMNDPSNKKLTHDQYDAFIEVKDSIDYLLNETIDEKLKEEVSAYSLRYSILKQYFLGAK